MVILPVDSELLTADANMLTADANFLTTPSTYYDRRKLNFNFRALMVGIEDIEVIDKPIYFGSFGILTKQIKGL